MDHASAAEQNNITQSDSNPQTAVNDQATTSPVQNNTINDTSNTSSTQNNIQDTQSDTNLATANDQTISNNTTNSSTQNNTNNTQNNASNTTTSQIANEDPAVITFDDGFESTYTIAFPIMQQYGIKGTVYVVPAWLGAPGYLTVAQLTILHNAGWTIANHTWDHQPLPTITTAQVTTEIQSTIDWLNENGFSDGAYYLAYPYGQYNDTVVQIASSLGIKTARTVDWGTIDPDGIVYPYETPVNYLELPILLIRNDTTTQEWQSDFNRSIAQNGTSIFLFHDIIATGTPTVLETITEDTFKSIIAYINQTGVKTETMNQWYNEMTNPAPVASFIATPVTGSSPLTVQFTDQSSGNSLSYSWDFNNDGIVDSTQQNPTYTYNTVGTYTVKLTVTNSSGTNSITNTNYITVNNGEPVANFTATPTSGLAPLNVQFTDQSTGTVTGWAWDFNNDGIIDSTLQNPTYTYNTPGNYTVKLTVTNTKGTDDEIKTNYITVTTPSSNMLTTNQQGVETDLTGFDSYQSTLTRDTSVKYAGNASAKAVANSGFSQIIFASDGKAVTAGTTYIVDAYVRANVATLASQTISIIYDWYTNGTHLAYSYQWVNLATIGQNTWYHLQLQATAPAGANTVYTSIGLGNANSGDTYWYDNGSLSKNNTGSSLPDLSVSNLVVPSNPQIGTTYPVTFTVTNSGSANAGSFVVSLMDGTISIGQQTITSLASGQSTTVSFNWIPTLTGLRTINATADVNNAITESNETNNNITQQVTVGTTGLPDLSVSNLVVPSNPQIGTTYPVTFTVTNSGSANAGSFVVSLMDGTISIGQQTITSLASGQSTTVSFNWTPTLTGLRTINATADVNNAITESNETNNNITQQVTVLTQSLTNLLTTNQQGVETDLTGFDSYQCTLTRDTSVKYAGNASAKAVASSGFSQIIFASDAKAVTAGTTYIADAYVRANVATLASQTITIIYDWYANGTHLAYSYQWVNLSTIGQNTWYYLQLQATAPAGATAVYMSIGLGNANSGDTYWYDNGVLQAVT